jgi:hypothetical protein
MLGDKPVEPQSLTLQRLSSQKTLATCADGASRKERISSTAEEEAHSTEYVVAS